MEGLNELTNTMVFGAFEWTRSDIGWGCPTSLGFADIVCVEDGWKAIRNGDTLARGYSQEEVAEAASKVLGVEVEIDEAFEAYLERSSPTGRYGQIESRLRSDGIYGEWELKMAVEDEKHAFAAGYRASEKRAQSALDETVSGENTAFSDPAGVW